jgi:flavin-dependent dehydrogenase
VSEHVDVVVVGGGTAGLQAALQLARVGRSVVVLERRPEGKSGARWCNGVLAWQYERAGLAAPVEPERRSGGGRSIMVSPSGAHRFSIEDAPIIEADMRELVERLRRDAKGTGVDLRWSVTDPHLELDWGRPVAIRAEADGVPQRIEADLFVDAAGRTGVLRSQVPELAAACPPASPADTCSAQQLVLEIADREGALAFLEAHGARPGDAVVAVGVAGGYSTINIGVDAELHEVSVLTGSIPSLGHATGPELVKAVRALHPWIGEPVFGGGGLIPLRRTYHRFTAPGIALVGDAAAQVMAGHGSGIGFGLIAGKVLAEAVGAAADPGDPDVLWRYQAGFLREFGATLAGYDAVRRMSVALGPDGVEELFASGVFSPALVLPGLDQRLGSLRPREAVTAGRALAARPAVARTVVPALAAMSAARAIYRAYPRARDDRALRSWEATTRVLPRQPA